MPIRDVMEAMNKMLPRRLANIFGTTARVKQEEACRSPR